MKKLKLWHAFPILALLVGFSLSCTKDYEIDLGFEITVPDDWVYFTLANEGYVYTAERTPVNEMDTLREYLAIYKESLPGYTLSTYYSAIKDKLLLSDNYVSTLEEKDTTINGADTKRIIFNEIGKYVTSERDTIDLDLISTMYLFYQSSIGYNLSFVSLDSTYEDAKPVFDDIISTFRINN